MAEQKGFVGLHPHRVALEVSEATHLHDSFVRPPIITWMQSSSNLCIVQPCFHANDLKLIIGNWNKCFACMGLPIVGSARPS